MIDKKLAYPFVVEPFQEDYTGNLSWANLGNHILRVSSLHAEAHGFGYTYMKEHNRGWVLARLVIEMESFPKTGEPYFIATWVNKIFGQFTDRLYSITGPDGKVYGHGYSTWALIDYDTRQPVRLDTLPDGGFSDVVVEEGVPIAPPTRGRAKNPELMLTHKAVYSDLDINGHVNSIRYIDLTLDTFPKAWHDQNWVNRVEFNYGLEGHHGEELRVFQAPLDEQTFALHIDRIENEGGETKETILARAILHSKAKN